MGTASEKTPPEGGVSVSDANLRLAGKLRGLIIVRSHVVTSNQVALWLGRPRRASAESGHGVPAGSVRDPYGGYRKGTTL